MWQTLSMVLESEFHDEESETRRPNRLDGGLGVTVGSRTAC